MFGSSAFIHSKCDKLDPRSKNGVFLGYSKCVKGYRVWVRDEPSFKVVVRKDVIFSEEDFPYVICYRSPASPSSDGEPLSEVEPYEEGPSSEVES